MAKPTREELERFGINPDAVSVWTGKTIAEEYDLGPDPMIGRRAAKDIYYNADPNAYEGSMRSADGMDWDAMIRKSSDEVNFEALSATSPEAEAFFKTVRQHPDLAKSVGAFLKSEGLDGLQEMQELLAGDGKLDPQKFDEMMNDPIKRGLVVRMLDNVAKDPNDDLDAEFAKKYTKAAIKFANNPNDPEAEREFKELAAKAGIDLDKEQNDAMMEMAGNIFSRDKKTRDSAIGGLMNMDMFKDLPPGLKEMLGQFISGFAGFLTDTGVHFIDGTQKAYASAEAKALEKPFFSLDIEKQKEAAGMGNTNVTKDDLGSNIDVTKPRATLSGYNGPFADAVHAIENAANDQDYKNPAPANNDNKPSALTINSP